MSAKDVRRCWAQTVVAATCALTSLAGCSDPAGPPREMEEAVSTPDAVENDGNLGAVEIDGVWLFRMPRAWGEQAELTGEARIDGDCLFVGDRVVIWSDAQMPLAARIAADARSGAARVVRIGGGESGDVSDVVSERCAVETVWLANWSVDY